MHVDDPAPLQAIDAAFDPAEGMTAAFVVTWKGRLIAERYGEGITATTPLESWSMGKSLTATPSPSEEAGLKLPTPAGNDPTTISYKVSVELQAGKSGRLVVVVTNQSETMVPELVLRWPTAVKETIFLAPFAPSQQRIREGGDPLVQAWTKWVDGPGEHGDTPGVSEHETSPPLPRDGRRRPPVSLFS